MLNRTKDSITFWDGDMNDTKGYGSYLSARAMINFRLNPRQIAGLIPLSWPYDYTYDS